MAELVDAVYGSQPLGGNSQHTMLLFRFESLTSAQTFKIKIMGEYQEQQQQPTCNECGTNNTLHPCQYQIEMFGNDDPHCDCCIGCTNECGKDV